MTEITCTDCIEHVDPFWLCLLFAVLGLFKTLGYVMLMVEHKREQKRQRDRWK